MKIVRTANGNVRITDANDNVLQQLHPNHVVYPHSTDANLICIGRYWNDVNAIAIHVPSVTETGGVVFNGNRNDLMMALDAFFFELKTTVVGVPAAVISTITNIAPTFVLNTAETDLELNGVTISFDESVDDAIIEYREAGQTNWNETTLLLTDNYNATTNVFAINKNYEVRLKNDLVVFTFSTYANEYYAPNAILSATFDENGLDLSYVESLIVASEAVEFVQLFYKKAIDELFKIQTIAIASLSDIQLLELDSDYELKCKLRSANLQSFTASNVVTIDTTPT